MKVSVTKSFTFDAAHQLPWHQGKCQRLHGHTYSLDVTVAGVLNEDGIVVDFDDLARIVGRSVIEKYDHQNLNDFFENPTAELLASSFFKILESEGLAVTKLTLWESPKSAATVEREGVS